MELADFRRTWQQPPAEAAGATIPLTDQTLLAMLTHQPNSPVALMKANARRDMHVGLAVILLNFINVWNLFQMRVRAADRWLLAGLGIALILTIVLFLAWTLRYKLRLLAAMETETVNLREHLSRLVRQFRQLMRTGEWLGLALGGGIVAVFAFARWPKLMAELDLGAPGWPGRLLLGLLLSAAVLVLFAYAFERGRAIRQRRYGRYLDQLEAALRELDEPAAPAVQS